jgi:hypothetical protein
MCGACMGRLTLRAWRLNWNGEIASGWGYQAQDFPGATTAAWKLEPSRTETSRRSEEWYWLILKSPMVCEGSCTNTRADLMTSVKYCIRIAIPWFRWASQNSQATISLLFTASQVITTTVVRTNHAYGDTTWSSYTCILETRTYTWI